MHESRTPSDSTERTANSFVALQDTLQAVWAHHAATQPDSLAVSHWADGRVTHRYTWNALFDNARRVATWLHELGVQRDNVCAIMLSPDPHFFPLYMGVVLVGALPSVLPYPNERLHPQKFRDGLTGMVTSSGLDWILTDAKLWARFGELVPESTVQLALADTSAWKPHAPIALDTWTDLDPDDTCLLQHSSGTTGLQKGVALSHRAVLEHVNRYGKAIGLRADDSVASWLPLYHDMGLIAALHLPLAFGIPIVQLDPFAWVVRPGQLLQAIAAESSTLCWLPNFAFNLLADRVRVSDVPQDAFQTLRLITSCSEPVRESSIQKLLNKFSTSGLASHMIGASFAMAETTFAITQTPLGAPPVVEHVNRASLADGVARVAADGESFRSCVSSGKPIEGCLVKVVGDNGEHVSDGVVGSIEVRSASLFVEYRNNELATSRAFRNGWFVTGDIGYLRNGELFVIGREKDLIIVAGKNFNPEDIEEAVSRVDGVTPGRVQAFEIDDEARGTGQIGIVVETAQQDIGLLLELRSALARAGNEFDVAINHIYFGAPRWLIKSSSGKLSRRANAARALAELQDIQWTQNS